MLGIIVKKVYPIWDDIPCQCRNMQVEDMDVESWYQLLNSTSDVSLIFKSILKQYYMLETLSFGCTPACNTQECSCDGGDCIQLCDFNVCNYTSLGDGICNPECRTKECAYDYCDCYQFENVYAFNVADGEKEQCTAFNATLCDVMTDCVVFNTHDNYLNGTDSWVGDFMCDEYCDNEYCNYDGLGQETICDEFWFTQRKGLDLATVNSGTTQFGIIVMNCVEMVGIVEFSFCRF